MIVFEVTCIYKSGNKQLFCDMLINNRPYNKLNVGNVINFIKDNRSKGIVCKNFIIVDNSYFRGKTERLKMEVLNNGQVRLGNQTQTRGNREGLARIERGTSREKEKRREVRPIRENSVQMSREVTNQSRAVQNASRTRFLGENSKIVYLPKCNNPKRFAKDFHEERMHAEYAPCVDEHSIEELSQMQCFGSKDLGFYVVEKDGNINSVLKSSKNERRGFSKDIMLNAIKHNGNKLDCFVIDDGGLVDFYMDAGFIPVCRVKFNKEYAPEGWNEEWGTPDVVMMMHNLSTWEESERNFATFGTYIDYLKTHGENSVPYIDDYDEALAYRDKKLDEALRRKYDKSVNGVFNRFKDAFSKTK